jgi:hypothetical protein
LVIVNVADRAAASKAPEITGQFSNQLRLRNSMALLNANEWEQSRALTWKQEEQSK